MDIIDLAMLVEAAERERALKRVRDEAAKRSSVRNCQDCDVEISEARRQAVPGATRCVRCQSNHEKESCCP
ncbi:MULTISPECIES: TraR/DksA C4-type zinc finger protein [Comamonas]|nr:MULTISPECIES: TraR/DksA C4-type zinc finger protein [Comamonas]KGH16331.1 hypothetical protein P607_20380 [Comamonas thiooxydans]KKI12128.1 hypothetical protein XA67_21455 [Comamonas thiooxydans]